MTKSPKSELPWTTMFAELFSSINSLRMHCILFSIHLLSEIPSRTTSMPIMHIAITCNTRYMISLTLFSPIYTEIPLGKEERTNVFNDKL